MDYTPTPPPQAPAPAPEYELKKDVSGAGPVKRGPQVINIIRYNEKNEKQVIPVKVPYAPKPKCKECLGRGYVGVDLKTGRVVICKKCYPMR
jgi:hypothetical protein